MSAYLSNFDVNGLSQDGLFNMLAIGIMILCIEIVGIKILFKLYKPHKTVHCIILAFTGLVIISGLIGITIFCVDNIGANSIKIDGIEKENLGINHGTYGIKNDEIVFNHKNKGILVGKFNKDGKISKLTKDGKIIKVLLDKAESISMQEGMSLSNEKSIEISWEHDKFGYILHLRTSRNKKYNLICNYNNKNSDIISNENVFVKY